MRTALAVIALFLFFNSINAQVSDSTIFLKEVSVLEVKPSDNYTTTSIDTLILQSDIGASLDEVLNKSSDIFVKEYSPGALSTLSFRGMGSSHTKIYWNGISLNSSMNGVFDLSLFNINFTDQIDVHYGASSLIDGSGSLGGSVKLQQKDVFERKSEMFLSQSIGSFSTYNTMAKFAFSNGKFFMDYRFSAISSKNDFEYLNPAKSEVPQEKMIGADYRRGNMVANVGWLINNNNVLSLKYIYQNGQRNLPKLNIQDSVKELQEDTLSLGFIEWRNYSKWFKSELKVGIKANNMGYNNENIQLKSKSTENNFFVQERLKYQLFKKVNLNSVFLYDYIEAFNDKYGSTKNRNEFQMIHDFERRIGGKWKAGVLFKSHFTSNMSLPFMPSANLGYQAIQHWLRISTNVSYHGAIPTMNDLYWGEGGNPDLKPETGISSELNFIGGKPLKSITINYTLSSYYSDIDDWILWAPDNSGIWKVSNVSRVQSYGFEANLSASKKVKHILLSAKVSYNWNVSEDENNHQLLYVPVHRMRLNAAIKWKELGINYNHQFTDMRYINTENNAWLPGYFLADLSMYYTFHLKWRSHIRVAGKVNNLYDEPYQSIANRPMPGRYYTLTLTYMFK